MSYCGFPSQRRRPLYRSRNGWIFGVCRGVADYADLSVGCIRCILILCALFTWFLPFVILYVLAALFMKPEPVMEPQTEADWEFYNSYASSRSMALDRLKRQFDQLERRTRRIETMVTAREFDWDQRLKSGL